MKCIFCGELHNPSCSFRQVRWSGGSLAAASGYGNERDFEHGNTGFLNCVSEALRWGDPCENAKMCLIISFWFLVRHRYGFDRVFWRLPDHRLWRGTRPRWSELIGGKQPWCLGKLLSSRTWTSPLCGEVVVGDYAGQIVGMHGSSPGFMYSNLSSTLYTFCDMMWYDYENIVMFF